ncbi:MAG: FtsX-like permease family protein [Crocinitomicaceae bacterium]
MIVTLAIVKGFQNEVREKIIGFGAHIQIMNSGGASLIESDPMEIDSEITQHVLAIKGVTNAQPIAYKTAIFQSKKDSVFYQNKSGLDTFQIQQEIKGVLFKGVDAHYDWHFFKSSLIEGRLPDYSKTESDEIIISKKIANQLHFKVNDRVGAFFVQKSPIKRAFLIVGIFETGLDDFDDDIVLADIRMVQEYSAWGIKASLRLQDTLVKGGVVINAEAFGGNGSYKFDWGTGYGMYSKYLFYPSKDTVIRMIASDYFSNPYNDEENSVIPDTAYLKISVTALTQEDSLIPPSKNTLHRFFLNDEGTYYAFNFEGKKVKIRLVDGKGSSQHYISGYEVSVNNWEQLKNIDKTVKKTLFYWSMEKEKPIEIRSITQIYGSIFSWLSFLDINFLIIICMMIIISIITMGAALLVLILEQTAAIGVLKSLGSTNWLIRKVFLIQAGYLILKGLIWGNIIGIGLCFLQAQFHIIPLDSAVYYLNAVPIELDFTQLLLLNLGTLIVCVVSLILPTYFITRISPVKALKFS